MSEMQGGNMPKAVKRERLILKKGEAKCPNPMCKDQVYYHQPMGEKDELGRELIFCTACGIVYAQE